MTSMRMCTARPAASSSPWTTPRHRSLRKGLSCRAEGSAEQPSAAPAAEVITLTIKKPLGLVLAERQPSGEVFVEEIVPGGNADATGQIRVGDVVAKTSAIVLKSGSDETYGREGHGQRLYDNWETVEFDCAGQDFSTVMAAIGSNNERWGVRTVTLTLRRDASSA